jgi:uncharacterized protein (DUF2235 family)
MANEPALKVADDLRGVKKGSRGIPLLFLALSVVGFIAYAIQVPTVEVLLITVPDVQGIPSKGANNANKWVIARVGPEKTLHFRLFDRYGEQVATNTDEALVAKNELMPNLLATLKKQINEEDWDKSAGEEFQEDNWAVFLLTTQPDGVFEHFLAAAIRDAASGAAEDFSKDYPAILQTQLKTLGVVALYALIPGLFGMVYRRAFWPWFGAASLILFVTNRAFDAFDIGAIAPVAEIDKSTLATFYLLEEVVLLLVIGFRLRRQSVSAGGPTERRRALVLASLAVLFAAAGVYFFYRDAWRHALEGVALLGFLALVLVRQARIEPTPAHAKNIVVCLDGTWNQPGQKDFDHVAVTNVYKLFRMCKGSASRAHYNASQFKVYGEGTGVKQVALYYQGVGNKLDNSELGQMLGGGFGLGASAIVERAYLDVVKAYRPGDRIFIFGFSRGAAIARLVAGVIGRRGVPMSLWTLRLFGQHWLLWKSRKALDVKIDVLGCWDTVGSFGISKNILGIPFQRINLLKDLTVSLSVKRAYHMLALDETRDSFEPTLMDPDPTAPDRIVEVWFSGNHSNVGGGYATDNLSDVTLDFLLKQISSGYAVEPGQSPGEESWGLYLDALRKRPGASGQVDDFREVDPDPRGTIRHSTGPVYTHAPRKLPAHAVIYDSVFDRMYDSLPVYAPQSLFDLNQDFVKKRKIIETEVGHLVATASLESEGSTRILDWSGKHLSLMKWSKYAELPLADATPLKQRWNPPAELQNPPPS